ncbi:MFS transporter [Estrella lausannensis]|uniref:Transporter, MFS family n=1 Tax=Estrella lausannensis TaxID=483423 RepID=A0A0H5DNT5_9BACT|nr:MFS transporter [Estrella lausannensis]CRX37488.1 Transporter, MFS family [Estrella lausannensis]
MSSQKIGLPLFILWLSHFLVDFMIGVWPVYKTIAELDLAVVGIMTAVCVMTGEGLQLLFGQMSDRGYRNTLIVLSLLCVSAPCFFPFASGLVSLFCILLIASIASGAFHPAAVSLAGSFSKTKKGILIAIFASGGSLGMAVSQLGYTFALNSLGGNTWVLILPFILLSLSVVYFGLLPKTEKKEGRGGISLSTLRDFFRHRELSLLYFLQLSSQTVVWAFIFLLPDILKARGYENGIALGGGHFFYCMGGALMIIPSGWLADRFSYKNVLITACSCGALLFYSVLFFRDLDPVFLAVALTLLGASIGVINPVSVAYGYKLMPEKPGVVSAMLMGFVWIIAEGVGQGGSGLLTKLFTDDAPAKSMAILGLAFLIAIFAGILLPGKREEVAEEPVTQVLA